MILPAILQEELKKNIVIVGSVNTSAVSVMITLLMKPFGETSNIFLEKKLCHLGVERISGGRVAVRGERGRERRRERERERERENFIPLFVQCVGRYTVALESAVPPPYVPQFVCCINLFVHFVYFVYLSIYFLFPFVSCVYSPAAVFN